MHRVVASCFVSSFLSVMLPSVTTADSRADLEAISKVLQQYRATEDAGDLISQSKLMAPDRVWINQVGERRTDNAENMRIQQMQHDAEKKRTPGVEQITSDRDVLIHFYAEGKVAIVSFYRMAYRVFPPSISKEAASDSRQSGETGTVVLEKQGSDWKIVHTHWSGR